jgi:hypothetical protein
VQLLPQEHLSLAQRLWQAQLVSPQVSQVLL